MRILILGGGTVGRFIAKNMSELKNDVTVVERRADARGEIDQYDVRVVIGDALQASVLDSVGASTADVCFALASSDEVNLISGSVAKGLGARRVAARVNSFAYRDVEKFDYRRHFQIDRFLCQDYMTAMEIARRIREPGDTFVEHFAGGELEMQEVVVMNKSSAASERRSSRRDHARRFGADCVGKRRDPNWRLRYAPRRAREGRQAQEDAQSRSQAASDRFGDRRRRYRIQRREGLGAARLSDEDP